MTTTLLDTLDKFDGRTLKRIHKAALDLLATRNPRAYLLALSKIQNAFPDAKLRYVKNSGKLPDDTGIEIHKGKWETLGPLVSNVFPLLRDAGVPVELNVIEDTEGSFDTTIIINGYFPHTELEFMTQMDDAVAISTVIGKLRDAWVPD